jgi:hypothetical protein
VNASSVELRKHCRASEKKSYADQPQSFQAWNSTPVTIAVRVAEDGVMTGIVPTDKELKRLKTNIHNAERRRWPLFAHRVDPWSTV